jgi:tripartite-type tricarboxylate transporter receptor subunit TctC
MSILFRRAAYAAAVLAMGVGFAQAQSDEFYKGKQLNLLVYSGPGSAYDNYARLLARYLPEHLPGKPTIVVQNMQGAGGLKLVDYMNRIAPRDGSVIGTIGRGLPFEPMLGKQEVDWDPQAFTWLGSMNREVSLAIAWHTAPVKTLDDLKNQELLVPGTGAGADSEIIPRAINNLVGTKFKIIAGYKDTSEAALQMQTGELQGIAYWSLTSILAPHPDWFRDRQINALFQTGTKDIDFLPGLPRIRDVVTDPVDKKALEFLLAREVIGRPFVAPPGLPAERTRALRAAFAASIKDPRLVKDAQTARMDADLVTGEEVEALLREAANSEPAVLARVKKALDR